MLIKLENPALVSKAIEQAQTKVEGFNFDIRKHLVEYDDVLNKQREIIYKRKRALLEGEKKLLREEILSKITETISRIVLVNAEGMADGNINEKISEEFVTIIPFDEESKKQLAKQLSTAGSSDAKIEFLTNLAENVYKKREELMRLEKLKKVERKQIDADKKAAEEKAKAAKVE